MKLNTEQLELGLAHAQRNDSRGFQRRRRRQEATWWFDQMRKAVLEAREWESRGMEGTPDLGLNAPRQKNIW